MLRVVQYLIFSLPPTNGASLGQKGRALWRSGNDGNLGLHGKWNVLGVLFHEGNAAPSHADRGSGTVPLSLLLHSTLPDDDRRLLELILRRFECDADSADRYCTDPVEQ